MTYCFNLQCQNPDNPVGNKFCQNCGAKLLLIEQYRVIKPLGEGSMSRTFLGEELATHNRHCVIKQMRGQIQTIGDPLRQEMSRLKALNHPQISQLFDYFEQENKQYLVQEYIEGQSLAKQLETEGEFKESQIRQILIEMLPVLQFIHSHQIIHRDINPENIIHRHCDQKFVLVGFGAAKYATQTALAKTGTLIGSAEYAPPEQLMGKAVFASDLYSLGVTCIHLITQIHPFDLFDTLEGKWVWRDYAGNRISAELSRILDKMLQVTLNRRYISAQEVWQDLCPLQPLKLPQTSIFKKTPKTPSIPVKIPAHFSEIQSELNSIAIPPIQSTFSLQSQPDLEAELTQSSEIELTVSQPVPPPPPQWKCVETFIGSTSSLSEITAVAFSSATNIGAGSSWDSTIQLWKIQDSVSSHKLPLHTLKENQSGVTSLAMSLDGQLLVSGNAEGTVIIWHLWQHSPAQFQTETPPIISQVLAAHTSIVTSVAISPNRQFLATGSRDQTIKLWDISTGNLLHTLSDHCQRITSVTFSPDSALLASAGADCTIKLWDTHTGTLQQTWQEPAGVINAITISPDQQILISGSWDRSVKFWQLATGTVLQTLQHHLLSVTSVAIHPNGKVLATGSADATIKVYSFPAGELLASLNDHAKGVTAVAFSPTETTLMSGSSDGTVKLWQCV